MIRPILLEASLFLTPFVVYAVFLWASRAGVLDAQSWTLPRVMWLTVAALVLMLASFLVVARFSGSPAGSAYTPAHIERGKLVPGASQ